MKSIAELYQDYLFGWPSVDVDELYRNRQNERDRILIERGVPASLITKSVNLGCDPVLHLVQYANSSADDAEKIIGSAINIPHCKLDNVSRNLVVTGDFELLPLLNDALRQWRHAAPQQFAWFMRLVSSLHLTKLDEVGVITSSSNRELPGWISLSFSKRKQNTNALISCFRHEVLHNMLYLWESQYGWIWQGDNKEIRSPWTGKMLNGDQFMHAVLVWLALGVDEKHLSGIEKQELLAPFRDGAVRALLQEMALGVNNNFDINIDFLMGFV